MEIVLKNLKNYVEETRRINILHGHYTPMKVIDENLHKIHSNVLHNSVDHILKSQVVTDENILVEILILIQVGKEK